MSAAPKQPEEIRHEPYSVEVESALLGSLLVNNRLIDIASAELEPAHFFDPLHARMFEFVVYLATEGDVSPLLLHAVMKSDAGLISVGGLTYIASLAFAAPSLPNIKDYARILRDLAVRRALIKIGEDVVNAAYEAPAARPAQNLADEATEALLRVGHASKRPLVSAYDTAMESLREAEKIATGADVPLVKTGLAKLDREIGGLRGGDFIVVPAKSGMGKSAIMGAVALNTARAQIPTLVFSLEMTRRQMVERMVCDIDFDTAEKPMWYSRVRNGRLSEAEFSRFGAASGALHDLPIEIHDEDDLTIQQIAARSRAFAAKHRGKLGIVILDYIQIINPGDIRSGTNREQVVNSFARGLKSLAKRLGWPVMAGSQMNEGAEQRAKEERRPQASDVRESKGVMNEADLMLSPYRPAYFVENRKPDHAAGSTAWDAWKEEHKACAHRFEILGLKNRHGRRFDTDLWCEIGSSAIRDEEPIRARADIEAVRGLLEGL